MFIYIISGRIDIIDPCYAYDMCYGTQEVSAKKGRWHVKIPSDYSFLSITHEDSSRATDKDTRIDIMKIDSDIISITDSSAYTEFNMRDVLISPGRLLIKPNSVFFRMKQSHGRYAVYAKINEDYDIVSVYIDLDKKV